MRKTAFFFLVMMVSCVVDAQEIRRLPCGYWCQLFGPSPTWTRVTPSMPREPFILPRGVGAVVAFNDMPRFYPPGYRIGMSLATETNATAAQIAVGLGIKTMKFWPRVAATGADMSWVIRHSGLDVIVIRPMQRGSSDEYNDCTGGGLVVWGGDDYGQIAENIYTRFSDLRITIILTGWESDHQAIGVACTPETHPWYPGEIAPYGAYVRRLIEERQAGVSAARARHPDAEITVLFAAEINDIDDEWNVARDILQYVHVDLVSVTYWNWNKYSLTELLDYVHFYSGVPRENIFIGEIGGPQSKQYDRIMAGATEAFDWGCRLVYVWHWKEAWDGDDNLGLWEKDEHNEFTGEYTHGMDAIIELNEAYN